ncbi:glycosyltransferase [Anabaena catenula]|uniref:Uncharacterized protein n=1 Tax=Anabaena catenula FACHB-362 TaxID=2692877 RepID=A0ABR8J4Z1_9NOST|nr:glycosyltransferase [Anabaena catenula]MBD2692096.1 hypothetical protein [Anabaena catenula FACHB-362]
MSMGSRQLTKNKKSQGETLALTSGMFEGRSFAVQGKLGGKVKKPDFNTSLIRAERYGHNLDRMQPTSISASQPIQAARTSRTTQTGQSSSLFATNSVTTEEQAHQLQVGQQQQQYQIPQRLHHFWAGGNLTQDALQNLIAWQEKAQTNAWSQTLWTDSKVNNHFNNPGLPQNLEFLKAQGINVQDMAHIGLMNQESDMAYFNLRKQLLQTGDTSVLPYMSDLARYTHLYRQGGVYADVDINPGRVDLSNPLTHRDPVGEVPLLGPGFRTQQDAISLGYDPLQPSDSPSNLAAINNSFSTYQIGNHFIATRPGTEMMKTVSGIAAKNLNQSSVTNGPSDVIRAFAKQDLDLDQVHEQANGPWNPHIKWITDESNNTVN